MASTWWRAWSRRELRLYIRPELQLSPASLTLGAIVERCAHHGDSGAGRGFRVVPHTPETAEALAVHETIMAEYDAVFRALAK